MAETEPSKTEDVKYPIEVDRPPVVTHHRVGNLKYTATVGMAAIRDEFGKVEAGIFYTAYVKEEVPEGSRRPLLFSFNGGPGSASVWLHLGVVGPKRVKMLADGSMPAPPFELVDNPDTWLEHADIVFIDPVGTGFSRPAEKDGGKKFWSLEGDVSSVGEFIRQYLSKNHRWNSPLYLVGESYGTTRAAGLAGHLIDKGIALNGIVLVSSILNFQTARFNKGNDLPYPLFLPTYTATAWYHGKLSGFSSLKDALMEAEAFASGEYLIALAQGDAIPPERRAEIARKLSRLTGLSTAYVESTNLRIEIFKFCKELLRDDRRTVGRLDSRFKGIDASGATEQPEHDPSMSAILAPYTATINDYLRRELGYETDLDYYVFNPGELWKNWTYGDAAQGHPDTSEALRAAISKNPYMKVFVASGYYDLATPYFATEFTLAHLALDPSLRGNIRTEYYEAGHMMYIDEKCHAKLTQDIAGLIV